MKKKFFLLCLLLAAVTGCHTPPQKGSSQQIGKLPLSGSETSTSGTAGQVRVTRPGRVSSAPAHRAPLSRTEIIAALTDPVNYPNYMVIASHRAQTNGVLVPENSQAGIDSVVKHGIAEVIELDIKTTKDRIPYLMHDSYLQRTTNFLSTYPGYPESHGKDYGLFSNYNWAETQKLLLRNADFTYSDQHPPLFRDVIKYVRDFTPVLINLDINHDEVFDDVWKVIVEEKAFDCVIFKMTKYRAEYFKAKYYEPLSAADKAKVIYFPMITEDKSGVSARQFYDEWEASGIAKGYEGTFKTTTDPKDAAILAVIKDIRAKNRVKVHTFSTLPDSYIGRYLGHLPSHQCCNTVPDARGDVEFVLDPFGKRNMNEGVNGYMIYDDPVGLHKTLTALNMRTVPKPPAAQPDIKRSKPKSNP